MAQIRDAIRMTQHQHGRMATWPVSIGMVTIEAAVELAIQAVKQEVEVKDPEVIRGALMAAAGTACRWSPSRGRTTTTWSFSTA